MTSKSAPVVWAKNDSGLQKPILEILFWVVAICTGSGYLHCPSTTVSGARIAFENGKIVLQILAMNPDPRELRSKAIETTMDQFDFAKVIAAAVAAGWNISTRPPQEGGVPTPDEMQRIARDLLERAWDDEEAQNCEYCHGGLRAARTDGCLSLQFVVEESYFVAALDAPLAGPGG